MNTIETIRFIAQLAPARILTVSGSDWSAEHNSSILLALGQGFLDLTTDGLVVSKAGLEELKAWEDSYYAKFDSKVLDV